MAGIVPQQSQVLINTEISNKIYIMGKDLLASKVYRLSSSFKLLFRLMPTKENKNKDIVKPYPRKILLKTLYTSIIIVKTIIKKTII